MLVVLSSTVVVVVLASMVVVVTLSSMVVVVVVTVVMLSAMVVVTSAVSVLSSLQPWRRKAKSAIRTPRATARTDIMAGSSTRDATQKSLVGLGAILQQNATLTLQL